MRTTCWPTRRNVVVDCLGKGGLGGWHVLVRVEEGDRGGLGGGSFTVAPFDLQVVAGVGELGWHPDVADVALQARRPDQVGDAAHPLPAGQGWPRLGDLEER